MMRKLLVVLVAALSLVSCGGGGSGLCQEIGGLLCDKACACREGSACAMEQNGLTISFDSESDCRALFVAFGCSRGDAAAYNDAAACLPLVEAATCTGTGTEGAVSLPADPVCESPG
jgi:hypothetical protein